MNKGSVRGLEIDYVDRKGQVNPIEVNATVLRMAEGDRIITLCRDITGRSTRSRRSSRPGQQLRNLWRMSV